MAEEAEAPPAPIIIKRIKKGGHGHHGGAWKVAYADFVTAMMAFFLLLWLINVTTPEQKRGLAEYFTPTIGIKDSMGIGFQGGKKPTPEGRSRNDLSPVGLVVGQPKAGPLPTQPSDAPSVPEPNTDATGQPKKGDQTKIKDDNRKDAQDDDQFKMTAQEVRQSMEQDSDLKDYRNNVIIEDTPEGLKIDMIDDEKKPMYVPGTATLTEMGKKVLDSMASIIIKTPNNIVIKGHTDASGSTPNPQYTNWELSADRANAARRFLFTTQLESERVTKVVGMADRELLTPDQPQSPRNRRVTIVLLRGSYFHDPKSVPNTRSLLSVPDAQVKKPEPKKPAKKDEPKPLPKNGPSIFDTPAASDHKIVLPKAPDAEARPELHLPTPKPAEAEKPEPPKTPEAAPGAKVPDLPIVEPGSSLSLMPHAASPGETPELRLSVPSPTPDSSPDAKKAAPQDKSPADSSDSGASDGDEQMLQPEGASVPPQLRKSQGD